MYSLLDPESEVDEPVEGEETPEQRKRRLAAMLMNPPKDSAPAQRPPVAPQAGIVSALNALAPKREESPDYDNGPSPDPVGDPFGGGQAAPAAAAPGAPPSAQQQGVPRMDDYLAQVRAQLAKAPRMPKRRPDLGAGAYEDADGKVIAPGRGGKILQALNSAFSGLSGGLHGVKEYANSLDVPYLRATQEAAHQEAMGKGRRDEQVKLAGIDATEAMRREMEIERQRHNREIEDIQNRRIDERPEPKEPNLQRVQVVLDDDTPATLNYNPATGKYTKPGTTLDMSARVKTLKPEKEDKPDPAIVDDRRYSEIMGRGGPKNQEEQQFVRGYKARKLLVPAYNVDNRPERPQRATPGQSAAIETRKQTALQQLEKRARTEAMSPDDLRDAKQQIQDAYEAEIAAAGGSPAHMEYPAGDRAASKSTAAAGPAKGQKKTYMGHEYTFDGKQWVR